MLTTFRTRFMPHHILLNWNNKTLHRLKLTFFLTDLELKAADNVEYRTWYGIVNVASAAPGLHTWCSIKQLCLLRETSNRPYYIIHVLIELLMYSLDKKVSSSIYSCWLSCSKTLSEKCWLLFYYLTDYLTIIAKLPKRLFIITSQLQKSKLLLGM